MSCYVEYYCYYWLLPPIWKSWESRQHVELHELQHKKRLSIRDATVLGFARTSTQHSVIDFSPTATADCPGLSKATRAAVGDCQGPVGWVVTQLYCTVLYCTVLYCTVLYCTVLY